MPHASWKGFLRLSLVSVPVQAFNAANASKGDVSFNQLHETCKSRIKYQKTCPIHGEVQNTEIVKGYEYAKGQYVIVNEDELDALRGQSDKAVDIDTFVKAGSIDPKYFDGRTYYLMPDGAAAKKPYALLLEVLTAKKLWGVARATISNREHLVVLREVDGVLSAATLHYASELRAPADISDLELPSLAKEELRLASALVDASTSKHIDLDKYQDHYNDQVQALLEAKVAGREIVAPPPVEETPVINLMDALRKSISATSKVERARAVAKSTLRRDKPRRPRRRKSAG